ncbi:MAG: DNA-binding protein WhiA [Lachnospiraceae bacterium]|nr:DNA-binding protein WhiA [Lachnospiraceae bacterium]
MSFSGEVKEELLEHMPAARHCQMAELSAMLHFCGQVGRDSEGNITLGFQTENRGLVTKGFTLLKKTYNIGVGDSLGEAEYRDIVRGVGEFDKPVSGVLIKNSCCKRAYIRGAFLSVGSISDPEKGYHLEFACTDEALAEQLKDLICGFDIEAKIVARKKYFVVYIKEGSGIVDLLNVCEAPKALMNLVNVRILKGISNSVNRRVNCETANLAKTVTASSKQRADIEYIRDHYGIYNLPDNLRYVAEVRLEYPDATLKELGEYLDPPVGKSGVNHRLRKICEFADKLRN